MKNQDFCRLFERQVRSRKKAAFIGIQCGVFAVIVLAVSCQAQVDSEKPASQSDSLPTAGIYDPDPNHLWNRLFVAFYRQKISSFVNFHQGDTVTNWVGPDVLDPPLGYHPRFLLDDEPFVRCNAVLDEFLSAQGAKLIHDPLKRVVLQRDLWAVFDVLTPTEANNPVGFPTTPLQEQNRTILKRKIGLVIRSLALSSVEIEALPDTYATAIRSGVFADKLETGKNNFLPPDLFATNSTWFEINPGNPHLQHSFFVDGRSVFRAFIKSPAGFTNVLGNHIRDMERWQWQYRDWAQLQQTNREAARKPAPQRPSGEFPVGTQLLLLREMICLDENLKMVPTHIIESVQFRSLRGLLAQQDFTEVELSRALLFQGKQGGLRAAPTGEPRFAGYDGLGHLIVDGAGVTSGRLAFPKNCAACHQTRRLFSSAQTSAKPVRSSSIESISRWKEKNGNLDQLREVIRSPAPDEK